VVRSAIEGVGGLFVAAGVMRWERNYRRKWGLPPIDDDADRRS
jgi:hypothetical protein